MTTIAAQRTWHLFDDNSRHYRDHCLQEIRDTPGPLTSWAPPPPDGKPVLHPFLSIHTHSTNHEPRLRELLEQSASLMDYLARIKEDGLRVELLGPPQRWRVLRDGRAIAELSDTPAFLAPKRPGTLAELPISRQFLSLTAPAADGGDDLRRILSRSESLSDFLRNLVDAGYTLDAGE